MKHLLPENQKLRKDITHVLGFEFLKVIGNICSNCWYWGKKKKKLKKIDQTYQKAPIRRYNQFKNHNIAIFQPVDANKADQAHNRANMRQSQNFEYNRCGSSVPLENMKKNPNTIQNKFGQDFLEFGRKLTNKSTSDLTRNSEFIDRDGLGNPIENIMPKKGTKISNFNDSGKRMSFSIQRSLIAKKISDMNENQPEDKQNTSKKDDNIILRNSSLLSKSGINESMAKMNRNQPYFTQKQTEVVLQNPYYSQPKSEGDSKINTKNSSEDLLKKFAIENELTSKSSSTIIQNNPQIYVNSNNTSTHNSLVFNSQITGNNIATPQMFDINEEDGEYDEYVEKIARKKSNDLDSSQKSKKSVFEEKRETIQKEPEQNNMISARNIANAVRNRGGFGIGSNTRIRLKKKFGPGLVLDLKKNEFGEKYE